MYKCYSTVFQRKLQTKKSVSEINKNFVHFFLKFFPKRSGLVNRPDLYQNIEYQGPRYERFWSFITSFTVGSKITTIFILAIVRVRKFIPNAVL